MALWTPANLAVAPKEWFSGDVGVTVSSGLLTAWTNQGANGNIGDPGAGLRPTTTGLLNGLRTLGFNGAPEVQSSGVRTYAAGAMYCLVVTKRLSSSTAYDILVATDNWSGGGVSLQFEQSSGNLQGWGGGYDNAPKSAVTTPAAATDGKWHTLEWGYDASPNQSIDGNVQTLSTSSGTSMPANTGVKFRIGYNGDHYNGDIAEVLFLNYRPTSGEVAQLQGYLAWKWGDATTPGGTDDLVSRLPAGHAYKSAAPTTGGGSPITPFRRNLFYLEV